jgi:hypothetical protein
MFWLSHLERKGAPLASKAIFFLRLTRNFLATVGIVAFSLGIGTMGYHYYGGVDENGAPKLGWIDGFLNASMILTGMGPVDKMETNEGKLFAAFYALYSGLVFLTMVVVLITPIYHRFIHRFHLDSERDADRDAEAKPSEVV